MKIKALIDRSDTYFYNGDYFDITKARLYCISLMRFVWDIYYDR